MNNRPFILALDVASRTGICEGRAGEPPRFSTVVFARPDDEHEDVFGRALRWMAERLQFERPDVVFIEAPLNVGAPGIKTNPETIVRLIGLWATLSAALKVKGVMYRRAKVQTVRKEFIGHGNLKGAEAKRRCLEMCRTLGWGPHNKDESDAGAIFWHGLTKFAPDLAPPITPMMQLRVATTIGGVDVGSFGLFKGAAE